MLLDTIILHTSSTYSRRAPQPNTEPQHCQHPFDKAPPPPLVTVITCRQAPWFPSPLSSRRPGSQVLPLLQRYNVPVLVAAALLHCISGCTKAGAAATMAGRGGSGAPPLFAPPHPRGPRTYTHNEVCSVKSKHDGLLSPGLRRPPAVPSLQRLTSRIEQHRLSTAHAPRAHWPTGVVVRRYWRRRRTATGADYISRQHQWPPSLLPSCIMERPGEGHRAGK